MPPHLQDSALPHSNSQNSAYTPSSQPTRRRPSHPNPVLARAEQQWILTEEELLHTPSIVDGMKPEDERERRNKGVNFIWQVGAMLKLPQVTLTTAAVFLQRFLVRRSLVGTPSYKALHHYQIAATALFLATKVEENCRKMRELVIACCRVAQKNPNLVVDEQTKDFWRWRDTILYNEDVLLEAICFDLTIESPHKILFELLKYYKVEHDKRLRNAAWAFVNDSSLTQLCLLYTSRTISASALYCAARLCDVSFPDEDDQPWWEVQYVSIREILRACNHMARVYETVKLKEGAENLYAGLHTPEDTDPRSMKTRAFGSQTPNSRRSSQTTMERSSSDQGIKRHRDDAENGDSKSKEDLGPANGVEANDDRTDQKLSDDEPEAKRRRIQTNGAPTTNPSRDETSSTVNGNRNPLAAAGTMGTVPTANGVQDSTTIPATNKTGSVVNGTQMPAADDAKPGEPQEEFDGGSEEGEVEE